MAQEIDHLIEIDSFKIVKNDVVRELMYRIYKKNAHVRCADRYFDRCGVRQGQLKFFDLKF